MQSLEGNSALICILLLSLTSCATSSYQVVKKKGWKTELEVTPDRILLQCEDASERKEVPYGFMIHVLDDQNTVLGVIQGNTLSKKSCFERIEKIGRILRSGQKIYVAGIGDIDAPRKSSEWNHAFPGHGTFPDNGRVLQFFAIANEHGRCYSAYYDEEKPCPREEFPIEEGK